ncbi:hypoxanthine phosphoribosyltransferase [Thermanaerothrix daxensis]|uniref:Hypoxanthine phosphoribosyltransferase n=1 Tax=Thermanaerothrix daxensis TaxID=869279 RepID=A0A0N8GQR1_9CHLR|nr:hypoxanthine phosphoribosyltransferase [Thermanaerothrix daxensis]KPL84402.1 hypoxanthine phosphoribosyltransferase [Thermanaerothrix daxensis]
MCHDYEEFLEEVLIPEEILQQRVAELGAQISRDYKESEKLILLCILRGGVMFLTDLIRHVTIPHMVDFMAVSSYGAGSRQSTGQVRITLDLNTSIENCDVLIVEDIIDSGRTLASVINLLSARKPRSLAVCTLLDKAERREVEVPLRYVGFTIPNKFVFGYGLDLDELYRNLPFIGVVNEEKYQQSRMRHEC